jgi:hypothetical protein
MSPISTPVRLADLLERWGNPRAGVNGFSLLQPHATMFALGERVIESRGWSTSYRGPVAIASSARWERDELDYAMQAPQYLQTWARHGVSPRDLPLGKIVAVGRLVACEDGEAVEEALLSAHEKRQRAIVAGVTCGEREVLFGSYGQGRTGFVFADVHRLVTPVPCKGRQGFWAVVGDTRTALEAADLVSTVDGLAA